VNPGQSYFVGRKTSNALVTTVKVHLPDTQPDDAEDLGVSIGCETRDFIYYGTQTVELPVTEQCLDSQGRFSVMAIMYNEDEDYIAYAKRTSIVPSGDVTEVTFNDWSTSWNTTDLRVENAPDGSYAAIGNLDPVRGGWPFNLRNGQGLDFIWDGGYRDWTLNLVPGMSSQYQLYAGVLWNSQDASTITRPKPAGDSVTVDLAVTLLPQARWFSVNTDYPARPTTWWDWLGDNVNGVDGILVTLAGTKSSSQYAWSAIVPPGDESFRFPKLPDALSGFRPSGLSYNSKTRVTYVAAEFVDGWESFRTDYGIDRAEWPKLGGKTLRLSFSR
jgi:hypothetical protein